MQGVGVGYALHALRRKNRVLMAAASNSTLISTYVIRSASSTVKPKPENTEAKALLGHCMPCLETCTCHLSGLGWLCFALQLISTPHVSLFTELAVNHPQRIHWCSPMNRMNKTVIIPQRYSFAVSPSPA